MELKNRHQKGQGVRFRDTLPSCFRGQSENASFAPSSLPARVYTKNRVSMDESGNSLVLEPPLLSNGSLRSWPGCPAPRGPFSEVSKFHCEKPGPHYKTAEMLAEEHLVEYLGLKYLFKCRSLAMFWQHAPHPPGFERFSP